MPPTEVASPAPWLRTETVRPPAGGRNRAAVRRLVLLAAALTLAACALLSGDRAAAAQAAPEVTTLERGDRGSDVKVVQRRLGLRPDGVFGPRTRRAVKRYQRRHGLAPDGVVGPATASALGLRHRAGSRSTRRRAGTRRRARAHSSRSATLERIAMCESGGNPRAVSASGRYRGKYQFSRATWRSVGGTGDPAEASEAEQDRRAARLLARRGTAPWPSCA